MDVMYHNTWKFSDIIIEPKNLGNIKVYAKTHVYE